MYLKFEGSILSLSLFFYSESSCTSLPLSPMYECVQRLVFLPQRLLKAQRSSRRESRSARFSSPLWSKCVPAQAKPSRPEPQRCSNRRGAREHAFPQTNLSKDKLFTSSLCQSPKNDSLNCTGTNKL